MFDDFVPIRYACSMVKWVKMCTSDLLICPRGKLHSRKTVTRSLTVCVFLCLFCD